MAGTKNGVLKYLETKFPGKKYPQKAYQLWSYDEEQQLIKELEEGINIIKISEIHERTIGGIKSRIQRIIYNYHKDNIPIHDIHKKIKIPEEKINELIQYQNIKENNKKEKKGKKEKKITRNEKIDLYEKLNEIDNKVNKLVSEIERIDNSMLNLD